jgi:CheY-like chemotaxis protein
VAAPKILVVEDNPSDIYILRRSLEDLGEEFEMEILTDGARAIQYVQERRISREEPPCVIVLDLHIPKHDGLEVLRSIHQEPALNHIEVVLLTNSASPREEAEMRRIGATYRLKPVGIAEYAELAADLIAICKGMQTAASTAPSPLLSL